MTTSKNTPQRAPWSPHVIKGALQGRGYTLRDLQDRWGCSYNTVRRAIGLVDDPPGFRTDYTEKRRDIADLLGVPYEDLCEAWADDPNDTDGDDPDPEREAAAA